MEQKDIGTFWDEDTWESIVTNFNILFDEYTGAGFDASEALRKAQDAVIDSSVAKDIAETTREEMINIIRQQTEGGDLVPEVVQARGDNAVLGDRLNSIDQDLAQTEYKFNGVVKTLDDFPKQVPETDDTGRINRFFESLETGNLGVIPNASENYKVSGLKLSSKTGVKLIMNRNIDVIGEGSIGLLVEACINIFVAGHARIVLRGKNQIGVKLQANSSGTVSQLNTFMNMGVLGEHNEGSVSLIIDGCWVNTFYNCHFFRSQDGIRFIGTHANANHFYGCEVRGDRNHQNSGLAILQAGGQTNTFFGGAIENYKDGIRTTGGSFTTIGTYVEGFGPGRRIFLEGGSLTIKDGLLLALIEVSGGESLELKNNKVPNTYDASVLNINYPLYTVRKDVPTKITTDGNRLAAGAYLTRFGKYSPGDGSGYIDRSVGNVNEYNGENNSLVRASLSSDLTGLEAGTYKRINYGNDSKIIDNQNEYDGQFFRAKFDGFYRISTSVRLTNLDGTYGYAVLRVLVGSTSYFLTRVNIMNRDNERVLTLHGDTIVKATANSPVSIEVMVSGDATSYNVHRGSAGSHITTLSISKV